MKKIKKLFMVGMSFVMLLLSACSITGVTPTDGKTPEKTPTEGVTETIGENEVKIKSISATKTEVAKKSRSRQNADGEEVTGEATPEITGDDAVTVNDNINYIIIYKSQTDITFTITLDNPEAYGIDALRVTCDDPEAQIQVDGEFKPIAQEADKTRVINWSSEDPYTKTYNIKTTSEEAIATFKVVDIRLAGHEKFQSKETENTDLGNNELKIYKMDDDAIELNVIENTFEYIKFDFVVKAEYTDVISNIKVDGVERDDEIGGWKLEESKTVVVSYDYLLEEYNVKVVRSEDVEIELLEFREVMYQGRGQHNNAEFKNPIAVFNNKLYIAFELNCDFNILLDGIQLQYIRRESGYYGFSMATGEPDPGSYYNFYIYELGGGVDVSSLPDYYTYLSNAEEVNNLVERFTILIYGNEYKFITHSESVIGSEICHFHLENIVGLEG